MKNSILEYRVVEYMELKYRVVQCGEVEYIVMEYTIVEDSVCSTA